MKGPIFYAVILCLLFISFIGCEKDKNPVINNFKNGEWHIFSGISNTIKTIFFINSQSGWAVGDNGCIHYTTDGGYHWVSQNSGTLNRLISVYFLDSQTGFACGYDNTLICTSNKGTTWTPIQVISDSGSIYSSLHSDNSDNLYLISNYGEIYWSKDVGTSWHKKYNLNSWGFSYLNCSNNPICYAMKIGGNSLYKSIDGGNSWIIYTMPLQWSGDIYLLDENHGWVSENIAPSSIAYDSISIFMTNDGGETWKEKSQISEMTLDNIVFVNIHHGWGSKINEIYFSADSGKSWTCQFESDNVGYVRDIFFSDYNNGWAVTSEGIIIKYSCEQSLHIK